MTKLLAVIATLLAASCGDSGPSPSPTPVASDRASLVVAIPPPTAIPIAHPQFAWAANFTVNLLEQAGIGVDVTEIVVELAVTPIVFDRASITTAARGNHIPGRGTLAVPLTIAFADPSLDVRVAVRGVDERGQAIEAFGRLFVIPAQRP